MKEAGESDMENNNDNDIMSSEISKLKGQKAAAAQQQK